MNNRRVYVRVARIGKYWFADFSWDNKCYKNLWSGGSESEAHKIAAEFMLQVRAKDRARELTVEDRANCGLLSEFDA